MSKLSVQSLKTIFDFFTYNPNIVLWIRSHDYQRQLYVSPQYEKIWGHLTEQLYENPHSWNDYLFPEDKNKMISQINARPSNQEITDRTVLFRIIDHLKEVQFIKDKPFILTNENNQSIGFGGISEVITEAQWHSELTKNNGSNAEIKQMEKYLFGILQNEMRIYGNTFASSHPTPAQSIRILNKNKIVELTERETQCITHLIAGKSAKQTAAIMHISTRTVEFHINNIKTKAECRTKLALLGKVMKSGSLA